MTNPGVSQRFREFFEYNVKPTWSLLGQGEFGFLAGAIVEETTGRNPYFWYREWRNRNRIVTRGVRGHEMQIDLYDRGISRHLFIRGVHEAKSTAEYRFALKELHDELDGKITVLDIGANIGYYVLEEVNALGDRGSIIAFEPDPENRTLLQTNVERNGYADMVDIFPMAVDDMSGEKTFYRSTHSNWNRLESEGETGNVDELVDRFSVETISVDEFLEERDIDPGDIHVARMDLEGHELKVLRGMETVLSSEGPLVLFVEFHPDFGDRDEYEEMVSILEEYGFSIQHVDQKWNVLDIKSFEELQSIGGSHVRVIVRK